MNLLDVVREVRRHLEENGRSSLRMLRGAALICETLGSEGIVAAFDESRPLDFRFRARSEQRNRAGTAGTR